MGRVARTKATIYSPPPETEVMLRELQGKFLSADECTEQVKADFFTLLRNYARSLTLKEVKRKGLVIPPERLSDICTDATLAILKQYQKEGWKIEASFAGALWWKIVEAMYGPAKEESQYSLNQTFSGDEDSKEFLDMVDGSTIPWSNKAYEDPEEEAVRNINVAFDEVETLLDQAFDILPYRLYIRFVPWLLIQIRRPKLRNSQQTFGASFLESNEEEAFDMLLLELRNRIYKIANSSDL